MSGKEEYRLSGSDLLNEERLQSELLITGFDAIRISAEEIDDPISVNENEPALVPLRFRQLCVVSRNFGFERHA